MSEPQEYGQFVPPPPPNNAFQSSTPPYVPYPPPQNANEQVVPPISGPQPVVYPPPPVASPAVEPSPTVVYSPSPSVVPPQPQPVVYSSPPVVVIQQQQQPQPATIVIAQKKDHSNKRTSAWLFFGLGFLFPFLWCAGWGFIRSKDRSTRTAGILSLSFLGAFVMIIILYYVIYALFQ